MNSRGIQEWAPGVELLRTYRREWFRSDLVAGVSVAAVALPIGIAYAQLAGFPPVVGIYSCILPPVAYVSMILTSITGLLCIAGGLSGLGVIANFLSRPILTGYLNGIARARGLFLMMLERAGVAEKIGDDNLFRTVSAGAKVFRTME